MTNDASDNRNTRRRRTQRRLSFSDAYVLPANGIVDPDETSPSHSGNGIFTAHVGSSPSTSSNPPSLDTSNYSSSGPESEEVDAGTSSSNSTGDRNSSGTSQTSSMSSPISNADVPTNPSNTHHSLNSSETSPSSSPHSVPLAIEAAVSSILAQPTQTTGGSADDMQFNAVDEEDAPQDSDSNTDRVGAASAAEQSDTESSSDRGSVVVGGSNAPVLGQAAEGYVYTNGYGDVHNPSNHSMEVNAQASDGGSDSSDEAPEEIWTASQIPPQEQGNTLEEEKRDVTEVAMEDAMEDAMEVESQTEVEPKEESENKFKDDSKTEDEDLSEKDIEAAAARAESQKRSRRSRRRADLPRIQKSRVRSANAERRVGVINVATLSRRFPISVASSSFSPQNSSAVIFLRRQIGSSRFGRVSSSRAASSRR